MPQLAQAQCSLVERDSKQKWHHKLCTARSNLEQANHYKPKISINNSRSATRLDRDMPKLDTNWVDNIFHGVEISTEKQPQKITRKYKCSGLAMGHKGYTL